MCTRWSIQSPSQLTSDRGPTSWVVCDSRAAVPGDRGTCRCGMALREALPGVHAARPVLPLAALAGLAHLHTARAPLSHARRSASARTPRALHAQPGAEVRLRRDRVEVRP